MGRKPIEVKPGDAVGSRIVIRVLPSRRKDGGGTDRQVLLRCPDCHAMSRSAYHVARRTECRCKRGGHKADSELFATLTAPIIAAQTDTIYGGMGRFWKVYADGDVRVLFVRREVE